MENYSKNVLHIKHIMLRIIICYILFLITFNAHAQLVYVYGTIKDVENNQLLSGVIINSDNSTSVLSDKNGSYSILLNKSGKQQLKFFMEGYKPLTKNIETAYKDTIQLNIKLSRLAYQLPAVSVSGTKTADTVFGTWKISIINYEFNDVKIILLTY